MKTYKEFNTDKQVDEEQIDEATMMSLAIERKLKAASSQIKSTKDVSDKIDLLADVLHFSLGAIAFNLNKSNKRRR